jgi:hypothetical protein
MAIRAVWDDNAQTIIRVTFEDDWKWDEFTDIRLNWSSILKSAGGRLSFIVDARRTSTPPLAFIHPCIDWLNLLLCPETDILVIVGATSTMVPTVKLMTLTYENMRDRLWLMGSVEEARARISAYRQQPVEVAWGKDILGRDAVEP